MRWAKRSPPTCFRSSPNARLSRSWMASARRSTSSSSSVILTRISANLGSSSTVTCFSGQGPASSRQSSTHSLAQNQRQIRSQSGARPSCPGRRWKDSPSAARNASRAALKTDSSSAIRPIAPPGRRRSSNIFCVSSRGRGSSSRDADPVGMDARDRGRSTRRSAVPQLQSAAALLERFHSLADRVQLGGQARHALYQLPQRVADRRVDHRAAVGELGRLEELVGRLEELVGPPLLVLELLELLDLLGLELLDLELLELVVLELLERLLDVELLQDRLAEDGAQIANPELSDRRVRVERHLGPVLRRNECLLWLIHEWLLPPIGRERIDLVLHADAVAASGCESVHRRPPVRDGAGCHRAEAGQ